MNDEIITSYLLGKKARGGGTPPVYEEKNVSITQNGDSTITAESGYDAISKVNLSVNVPQPSGKISITQNGTDIDVSSYATADVNVGGTTIDSVSKLNTAIDNNTKSYINYLNSINNTKTAYTNDSVTLYTPNSEFSAYIIYEIRNVQNTTYNIYWIKNNLISYSLSTYNTSITYNWLNLNANNVRIERKVNGFEQSENQANYYLYTNTTNRTNYYSSTGYSSVEEAVNALKNPSTTYTYTTNTILNISPSLSYIPDLTVYSNNLFFNLNNINEMLITKIISHNETIEVIPSE